MINIIEKLHHDAETCAKAHTALAALQVDCAARVVNLYEQFAPGDDRPRKAIEAAKAVVKVGLSPKSGWHWPPERLDLHKIQWAAAKAAEDAAWEAKTKGLKAAQPIFEGRTSPEAGAEEWAFFRRSRAAMLAAHAAHQAMGHWLDCLPMACRARAEIARQTFIRDSHESDRAARDAYDAEAAWQFQRMAETA